MRFAVSLSSLNCFLIAAHGPHPAPVEIITNSGKPLRFDSLALSIRLAARTSAGEKPTASAIAAQPQDQARVARTFDIGHASLWKKGKDEKATLLYGSVKYYRKLASHFSPPERLGNLG